MMISKSRIVVLRAGSRRCHDDKRDSIGRWLVVIPALLASCDTLSLYYYACFFQ
jgi:hypothetical protein